MYHPNGRKQILALLLCLCMLAVMIPACFAEGETDEAAGQNTEAGEPEDRPDGGAEAVPEYREDADRQSDWETRLLLMLQEHNADPETVGAGYYNFATGEEHYYNGDVYRVSGSMYKVPLNMLFLDWVAEGEIGMDELISGYRYSELLEGTVINSDNDYARILWDYAGATIQTDPASTLYHRYRILIAPLMGEDPENVDDKYYENNFFTPRQMITCLRNLYDGGERYDRLISTMQRAEPEKYFKLRERRFNIAHKYGWYAEDPILYLNDCALCFTDDPIAIVLFTTGTENAYGVLTDYCTLMCDYAQETHEKRAAREREEAEAIAAAALRDQEEAAKKAEETAQEAESTPKPQKPNEETAPAKTAAKAAPVRSERSVQPWPVAALALIVGCALAAIAGLLIAHRLGPLKLGFGILAVLLTAAATLICFPSVSGQSFLSPPGESAGETAARFFQALSEGDAQTADSCLADGATLGLESMPKDETHAAAMQALKESWSFKLLGECSVQKTEAWQELQLQVLDFTKMESDLQRATREQLLELGRTMARSDIYDENGDYRPEAVGIAYDRAMAELLEVPQEYYSSVGLRIRLVLTRDGWKVVPDKELLGALGGNV